MWFFGKKEDNSGLGENVTEKIPQSTSKVERDDLGRVVHEEFYQNGKLANTYDYKYDSDNLDPRKLVSVCYHNGVRTVRKTEIYDGVLKCLALAKEERFDKEGEKNLSIYYTRQRDVFKTHEYIKTSTGGLVCREDVYDDKGNVAASRVVTSQKNGRVAQENNRSESFNMPIPPAITGHSSQVDEQGRLVADVFTSGDNAVMTIDYGYLNAADKTIRNKVQTYYKNGMKTARITDCFDEKQGHFYTLKEERFDGNGDKKSSTYFRQNGLVEKEKIYAWEDGFQVGRKTKYNENGFATEKEEKIRVGGRWFDKREFEEEVGKVSYAAEQKAKRSQGEKGLPAAVVTAHGGR